MSDFSIGCAKWPGISKLTEEAGEVKDRLEDEMGDALAAIEFVVQANKLDGARIEERRQAKLLLFRQWHDSERR